MRISKQILGFRMTKTFLIIALIFSIVWTVWAQDKDLSVLQTTRRNLMPVPASVQWKQGRLPVGKNFTIAVRGQIDDRLRAYIFRIGRRLEGRTGLEFSRELSSDATSASLVVEAQSFGK